MPAFDLEAWRAVEAAVRLENERQRRASLPAERRYRSLHPQSAEFIFLLVLAVGARRILEVGTSAGYSTLWLARACATAGGSVVSLEKNVDIIGVATENLEAAGVASFVEIKPGDARETLASAEGPFELAFVDGEKDEYVGYVEFLWPKLSVGASLVADNVISHADATAPFLEWLHARTGSTTTVLEIGNGLSWTVKGGKNGS